MSDGVFDPVQRGGERVGDVFLCLDDVLLRMGFLPVVGIGKKQQQHNHRGKDQKKHHGIEEVFQRYFFCDLIHGFPAPPFLQCTMDAAALSI